MSFEDPEDLHENKNVQANFVSPQFYREIVENTTDVIYRMKLPSGEYEYINKACEDLFGVTRQEILNNPLLIRKLIHPDFLSYFEQKWNELIQGHVDPVYEYKIIHPLNGERWIHQTNQGVFDEKNQIIGIDGICRDFTEKFQLKEKYKEALEKSKNLQKILFKAFQQAQVGIILGDKEGKITFANSAALGIRSGNNAELVDIPIVDHVKRWQTYHLDGSSYKPEDLPLSKAILQGINVTNEKTIIRRSSGEDRIVTSNASPVRNDHGDIIGGIVLFQDISNEILSNELLSAEKIRSSTILDSIIDGVISTDVSGKIQTLNSSAEQILGEPEQNLQGVPIYKVLEIVEIKEKLKVEPKSLPLINPYVYIISPKTQSAKRPKFFTFTVNGIKSNDRDIEGVGGYVIDKNEKILGIVFTFRDVTDQRKRDEIINKNQKIESISLLAGGIAHDFNNLLTTIVGNLSLARLELPDSIEALQYLEDTEKAVILATNLTKQLLTFSKGGNPVKERSSLREIISDSTKFVLHGSKIELNVEIPENLWWADVDKGQIHQVIHNIILNAKQAIPSNGKISITAENQILCANNLYTLDPGKYIHVYVKDNGVGISKENLNHIFQPYFTTKPHGNGLGLSISYSIIQKHGGILTVESELGKYTCFHILLPAQLQSEIHDDLNVESLILKPKFRNVIVLEDEEGIQRTLAKMLDRMGLEFAIVEKGEEVFPAIKEAKKSERPFDLAILDLTIPGGLGGEEIIEKLKNLAPEIYTIASSGYTSGLPMTKFRDYGFDEILVKPYTFMQLKETLQKIELKKKL